MCLWRVKTTSVIPWISRSIYWHLQGWIWNPWFTLTNLLLLHVDRWGGDDKGLLTSLWTKMRKFSSVLKTECLFAKWHLNKHLEHQFLMYRQEVVYLMVKWYWTTLFPWKTCVHNPTTLHGQHFKGPKCTHVATSYR